MPSAKVTLAANEQGKYMEMVEAVLDNGADVSDDKLKEYAKKIGINFDKLKADLKNNDAKYTAQIAEDMKLVREDDVRGTPTFFINGKKTQARDLDSFKAEVERILAKK